MRRADGFDCGTHAVDYTSCSFRSGYSRYTVYEAELSLTGYKSVYSTSLCTCSSELWASEGDKLHR